MRGIVYTFEVLRFQLCIMCWKKGVVLMLGIRLWKGEARELDIATSRLLRDELEVRDPWWASKQAILKIRERQR